MRVLSIDGGGIRGLIPASILAEVEAMFQEREGPQARLADYFDLVAGTSTGGIIAGLLLAPEPGTVGAPGAGRGRPARSAQDAVDFYLDNGSTIFARPLAQRIRRIGGFFDERYASTGFERVLDGTLGPRGAPGPDVMLSDLLRPTVIPTYNATTAEPYFFKQHEAAAGGLDVALRDVVLATSAAPTYFEPVRVTAGDVVLGACIDGGVFANNPTMCAYAEAVGAFGMGARDLAVLSLGTGSSPATYTHRQIRGWGLLSWARPLIDMMLVGSERTVDRQIREVFRTLGPDAEATQYLRMQASLDREPKATAAMDNADPANLRRLVAIGRETVAHHREALERFIDTQLLVPPDDGSAHGGPGGGAAS